MFRVTFNIIFKTLCPVAAVLSFALLMSTPFEAHPQPPAGAGGGSSTGSGQTAAGRGGPPAPNGGVPSIDVGFL